MKIKRTSCFSLLIFLSLSLFACKDEKNPNNDTQSTKPTANAGVDQTVAQGDFVILDASASLINSAGTFTSYSWAQTSGDIVTLDKSNPVKPSFTAPAVTVVTTLIFRLSVVASNTEQNTDDVIITVTPNSLSLTADAGIDQDVVSGEAVTLDGSNSSASGLGVTLDSYSWIKTSGPVVTLDITDAAKPTFTAPIVQTVTALIFELTVVDSNGAQSTDSVNISVNPIIAGQMVTWKTNTKWAAFQDGPTGQWRKLTPQNNSYVFSVTNARGLFGIAEYNTDFGLNLVEITYLSLADLSNATLDQLENSKVVNFMITGTTNGQAGFVGEISDGSGGYWANPNKLDTNVKMLKDKPTDLLANIHTVDAVSNNTTSRYYVERNVDFSTITNKAIDFLGAQSFDAAPPNTVTMAGLDSTVTKLIFFADLVTKNKSALDIAGYTFTSGTQISGNPVSLDWRAIPAGKANIDDKYVFEVYVDFNTGGTTTYKEIRHTMMPAVDRTLTLPNNIDSNILDWSFVANGGNVISKFQWNNHVDSTYGEPKLHVVGLLQSGATQPLVEWIITINSAWFESSNVVYETPNFSAISGWDAQFSLIQGNEISATYRSWHSNVTFGDLLDTNNYIASDGDTVNIVGVNLVATP